MYRIQYDTTTLYFVHFKEFMHLTLVDARFKRGRLIFFFLNIIKRVDWYETENLHRYYARCSSIPSGHAAFHMLFGHMTPFNCIFTSLLFLRPNLWTLLMRWFQSPPKNWFDAGLLWWAPRTQQKRILAWATLQVLSGSNVHAQEILHTTLD